MVLVSRAHLFRPTYPPSKERMIGPQALFFHQGDYHLRMRRVVQGWLGPDALRALVPDVEAAVASTLRWWEGRETSTFHTMKRVSAGRRGTRGADEETPVRRPGPSEACAGLHSSSSIVRLCWLPGRGTCPANLVVSLGFSAFFFQLTFDVGVVTIFGRRMAEHVKEELRRNYFTVERGYNSFPIPVLPWTRYSQAIKVRRRQFFLLEINGARSMSFLLHNVTPPNQSAGTEAVGRDPERHPVGAAGAGRPGG
jgi:hypothetical protein